MALPECHPMLDKHLITFSPNEIRWHSMTNLFFVNWDFVALRQKYPGVVDDSITFPPQRSPVPSVSAISSIPFAIFFDIVAFL